MSGITKDLQTSAARLRRRPLLGPVLALLAGLALAQPCDASAQTAPAPTAPAASAAVASPSFPADCQALARPAPSAAPDGRDRGLLWRIERAGRVSHLYGTMHVGRAAWGAPGPKLRQALAASDVLAVELDVSDPGISAELLRALPPLPEPPQPLAERMAAAAVRVCADPRQLAPLPPLLRAVTLTLFAARRDGLDAAFGMEPMLIKAAREAKLPVISLEDAATQMQALSPEHPSDFEAMLDVMLRQMENGESSALLMRLVSAWENGNAADVADYPRWCNCLNTERERIWNARINDERNGTLASRIDALHTGGQRVFAAIGALHMSGPEALPLLLARRGFTVQMVPWQ